MVNNFRARRLVLEVPQPERGRNRPTLTSPGLHTCPFLQVYRCCEQGKAEWQYTMASTDLLPSPASSPLSYFLPLYVRRRRRLQFTSGATTYDKTPVCRATLNLSSSSPPRPDRYGTHDHASAGSPRVTAVRTGQQQR